MIYAIRVSDMNIDYIILFRRRIKHTPFEYIIMLVHHDTVEYNIIMHCNTTAE